MSLSRAICLLLALCLPLAACGFQPLHKGGGNTTRAATTARDIEIANIPDRDGQYLRNALIDRLYVAGRPAAARYVLHVAPLRTEIENTGIRKDATSTRGQMTVSSVITLVDRETGAEVLSRPVRAVGAYNQLDNQFATVVSKEYVTDRLLDELGDTITRAVDLYFFRTAP